MAGKVSDEKAQEFAADTFTVTTHQLAGIYDITESTVRDWRLHCKRKLELAADFLAFWRQ